MGTGHIAVIVNPAATRVDASVRSRLRAALELSATDVRELVTPAPGTAASLAAGAAADGAALVVALGGDGHAADVLGALIGTGVPVALVPGGNANVIARALGWPARQATAIERLCSLLPEAPTREVRLGLLRTEDGTERAFGLNAGIGLDADAVARVERRPRMKHRLRHGAFALSAVASAVALSRRPAVLSISAGSQEIEATTLLVCSARPYTYVAGRELDILPAAAFDGSLAWRALQTSRLRHLGAIGIGLLVHRRVTTRHTSVGRDIEIRVESQEPVAVHADGEALGMHRSVTLSTTGAVIVLDPRSLKSGPEGPITLLR